MPAARGVEQRRVLWHLAFGSIDEIAEDGEVNARDPGSPNAATSRRSSRSSTSGTLVSSDGHDHHRPRVRRHAPGELEALQARGTNEQRDQTLDEGDGHFAGRQQQRAAPAQNHGPECPPAGARRRAPSPAEEGREETDRSEVEGRRRRRATSRFTRFAARGR